MDFKWGIHLDLGDAGREDEVSRLLADARVLEVGRWVVSGSKAGEFKEMLERQEREEEKVGRGSKIAEGWTVEVEGEGGRQFVRVRGWEKLADTGRGLEGHEGFVEGEGIEVKVMRNLEEVASGL